MIGTTAALIGLAASQLGGAAVKAVTGASAAKSAAKTQSDATDKALALQSQIWGQQQQNEQPYMAAGKSALDRINANPFQPYNQQFTGAGGSTGYQPYQVNNAPAPSGPGQRYPPNGQPMPGMRPPMGGGQMPPGGAPPAMGGGNGQPMMPNPWGQPPGMPQPFPGQQQPNPWLGVG